MSSSKWFIVLNSRVEQGLGLQVWELQKPFSYQPMSSEPLWKLQELLFPCNHGWKETPSLCLSLALSRTGAPCWVLWMILFSIFLMGNHNVPAEMEVWNCYPQNYLFLWLQFASVLGFPREMLAEEGLFQLLLSCQTAEHGRESHLSSKMELVLPWM